MQKVLNQEEIDLLFQATQKGQIRASTVPAEKKVLKFDLREVGQISKEQARALSVLHENFARNVSNSLGAYLRVGFEVNIVSVEQLKYSEVVSRMSEMAYLCSIQVKPLEAVALLQMDLSLAFPIIDLILGGAGAHDAIELRNLTEIEQQIVETVVGVLARELQACWAPVLDVEFAFEQILPSAQAAVLMPPTERNLALSFEIKLLKAQGMLNIALPAVVSNTLLRKLRLQFSHYKRTASPSHINQLRTQILDLVLPVTLSLQPSPVRLSDLTALQAGQILPLPHLVQQPGVLSVADEQMFLAYPVACGQMRGGQIQSRVPFPPASRKVNP